MIITIAGIGVPSKYLSRNIYLLIYLIERQNYDSNIIKNILKIRVLSDAGYLNNLTQVTVGVNQNHIINPQL